MNNKFIEVFPQFEEVTAFFSTKEGAADGYPYNREDVFEENYLDGAMPVWPKQVHKDHIELIEQRPYKPVELAETDGMITNLRGVLLTTVHAGWRGTDLGIAPKAVQMMMKEFRSYPEDIQVFIGPGISKCCFEVGAEVYEQFKEHWDFIDEFAEAKGEKYYLDLKGINRRQLEEMGIPTENIVTSEHCTHCEPDTFCSYRREGGTYKRMGAGICLI